MPLLRLRKGSLAFIWSLMDQIALLPKFAHRVSSFASDGSYRRGHQLADVAIIGTLDVVFGEIDR